ncbi:copper homeostasis protein [Tindallia magadiensis]|uniref:PF03932 family protein CutC n=1 Tax=Tindallia magadiensis TaxID=69895 RepID=A0A1I3HNG8_9FIRM|nr:copper homeostasis protein CutC [Tindallia magadiensis]SFI37050.1 copper homeostasis protein [Tindallia magadiensis]
MVLEVCVDSYTSLMTAIKAGADRIELCSALNMGGLTPSYGFMQQAKDVSGVEIYVMIRPRSGDFLYDDGEYETMKKDVEKVKKEGFHGIVIGFLKADGRLDLERLEEMVKLADPLKVVLHRAFDDANQPEKEIPKLIEMGIQRILTSGQRKTATEGVEYIQSIEKEFGKEITIMPGAGVSAENIETLYKKTGCTHYHMSGKTEVGSRMEYRECIQRSQTPPQEFMLQRADYEKIRAAKKQLIELEKEGIN